jgi:hypothetical protein
LILRARRIDWVDEEMPTSGVHPLSMVSEEDPVAANVRRTGSDDAEAVPVMEMHRVMTPKAAKSCAGGNARLTTTTTKWKDEPIAPQLALDENDDVLRIVQKTVKALSTDDAHRSET